jgi:hypothetical protein
VEGDDDGEDKVDTKQSRGIVDGLLEFVGAVSVSFGFHSTRWVLNDHIQCNCCAGYKSQPTCIIGDGGSVSYSNAVITS